MTAVNLKQKTGVIMVLFAVWLPQSALACSVCFSAREETRAAFYQTTALLTLLPLFMLAGFVIWIRRRFKRAEGSDIKASV